MRIVDHNGAAFHVPDPKAAPTQGLLTEVYDRLDEALDFLECVYQATFSPDFNQDTTDPLRAVLDVAKAKVRAGKDQLHDTIAWAGGKSS